MSVKPEAPAPGVANERASDPQQADFTFAGESIRAIRGQNLAAALCAAGHMRLGAGPLGCGRGLFCGMGVCHECLVDIDGSPSHQACMVTVVPGMVVEPQNYRAVARPVARPIAANAAALHEPDILVIGAGPAGLSAARAAALCGAKVHLVDERTSFGGQYFKQPAIVVEPLRSGLGDAQSEQGRRLIEEVERLGVVPWKGASVWGGFPPREIGIVAADGSHNIMRPKQTIIATGAYERGVPIPGWTLPGFMTTGAAQTLLRAHGVAPGRRVLIAGNGPLNLQLAVELLRFGCAPVVVAEAAPRFTWRQVPSLCRAGLSSPSLMWRGAVFLKRLREAGVQILPGHAVVAAVGHEQVERAIIAAIDEAGQAVPGTERDFAVDVVCAGYGLMPAVEISQALGCAHSVDSVRHCLVPDADDDGLTSVSGVRVAGDCVGLGGAEAAQEQGLIAGVEAARALGMSVPPSFELDMKRARQRLSRHRAFQSALWNVFRAPVLTDQLARPDTPICRCEGISLAGVTAAIEAGATSLDAVKKRTRAGMGRCQARYCASVIASLLPHAAEADAFRPMARPPVRPAPIGSLAEPIEPA